ncbi:MAG: DUF1580 domain-containing protein [Planctomycetaceae bacterium]|nr:DUF1580 domain-containing protein [Planctomycetaceae bacterium]
MPGEQFDAINAIPLNEVPAYVPGRPSVPTVWRWILSGVKGPNGERIELRSFKVAGKRFVNRDAVREFIAAWNADAPEPATADSERVNRALEKLGC